MATHVLISTNVLKIPATQTPSAPTVQVDTNVPARNTFSATAFCVP